MLFRQELILLSKLFTAVVLILVFVWNVFRIQNSSVFVCVYFHCFLTWICFVSDWPLHIGFLLWLVLASSISALIGSSVKCCCFYWSKNQVLLLWLVRASSAAALIGPSLKCIYSDWSEIQVLLLWLVLTSRPDCVQCTLCRVYKLQILSGWLSILHHCELYTAH